mmetsp:Transcript_33903/g.71284  ORF Transcript_33903/g.71284 Transcript_33903/m.71284 type:complete len:211 (+) Transcript_33903:1040-1672(+)
MPLFLGAKENVVLEGLNNPKPVEVAPNPDPKPVDFGADDEAPSAPPPLELLLALSPEEDGIEEPPPPPPLSAPNPFETPPNPAPNPPETALDAAPPNPAEAAEPNVNFALDPNTAPAPLVVVVVAGPEEESLSEVSDVASFTEAKVPPPDAPPAPPPDPHLLLALTIFRFFKTSSEALLKGSLRFPPSSLRSSSPSDPDAWPSGCSSLLS